MKLIATCIKGNSTRAFFQMEDGGGLVVQTDGHTIQDQEFDPELFRTVLDDTVSNSDAIYANGE